MPEAQQKPAEPSSRRFVTRLGDKITDHAVAWLIPGGAVAVITLVATKWPYIRAIFWGTKLPLIVVLLLAIPASFGFYAFYRVVLARRYIPLYFTIDPTQAHISEHWNGQTNERLIGLQLSVTVANPRKDRTLILYAYLKGTRPITHFFEPIEVRPFSAMLQQRVLADMTAPKRPKKGVYKGTVYFVDAGGHHFKQKAQIKYHALPSDGPGSQLQSVTAPPSQVPVMVQKEPPKQENI